MKYTQNSFSVSSTSKDAQKNYEDNYDRIFRKPAQHEWVFEIGTHQDILKCARCGNICLPADSAKNSICIPKP